MNISKNTDTTASPALLDGEFSPSEAKIKLDEVALLVQEFRKLQVNYATALEDEGLSEEVDALERWAESYRRGLKAAIKISENGQDMLEDVRKRLKLAADELTRISSESPNPAPKGEGKKAEAFLEATRSIDAILPAVEHAVTNTNDNANADQKTSTPKQGE